MADIEEEILLQANLFLLLVLKRRHRQLQNRRKHRFWVRKIFMKRQELGNKCHTWPFLDLNISSLFLLIYFLLNLSTFSSLSFLVITLLQRPECCLCLVTVITNFLVFFLFLQLSSCNFLFSFSIFAMKFL